MAINVVRSAGVFMGANMISVGIPFLLLPILTRVLAPHDYGLVAMFSVMLSIFVALTGLSLNGAISVRFHQLDSVTLSRYVGCCIAISVAIFLVLSAFGFFFGNWMAPFIGLPSRWLAIVLFLALCTNVINIRLALWQAGGHAVPYAVFQVLQAGTNAGLSLLLVLGFAMAGEGRVFGQGLAVVIFAIVALLSLVMSKVVTFPRHGEGHLADCLRFGVPLLPHALGALAISTADRFVITNILGVESAGIYMLGLQLGLMIGLVSDAFVKVYGPWLNSKLNSGADEASAEIVGVTYLAWIAFFVVSVLAYFFLNFAFSFFFGSGFLGAKELMIWFFLGQAFQGMYLSVAGFFFFTARTSLVSVATATSGGVSIVGSIIGCKFLGLEGAAISYFIAQVVAFCIAWGLSVRVCKMPWFEWGTIRGALARIRG
ncbi:oligosaccharide flippase family protein [Pseudomonas sp. LFM046]|uniref:lipopolysaccharide biosynthesis protein n=1 Tax=Pseudomonas sp. LFM046 TaxID=1608357 RepID=UPI0005CF936D|nr:oligosaccharide flippase family protein [Pseudomonas sp. LFM046]